MKTHQLFCCALIAITSLVFSWAAQTAIGEIVGYIVVVISMVVFSKNMIARMDT